MNIIRLIFWTIFYTVASIFYSLLAVDSGKDAVDPPSYDDGLWPRVINGAAAVMYGLMVVFLTGGLVLLWRDPFDQ